MGGLFEGLCGDMTMTDRHASAVVALLTFKASVCIRVCEQW